MKKRNLDKKEFNAVKDFPLSKNLPTAKLHFKRNRYNKFPTGNLLCKNNMEFIDQSTIKTNKDIGMKWHIMPWYFSIFHNPIINVKLIHYDGDDTRGAVGSSEIIVPRKSIKKASNGALIILLSSITEGSYNYRDLYISGNFNHFIADILPNMIYCKCIGK